MNLFGPSSRSSQLWHFLGCGASMTLLFSIALLASPLSAQTKPDIVLQGTLTHSDHESYRALPFRVPAGVRRITVQFSYTAREQHATVDLGMLDPVRFRGWSGGARNTITISATDSTPAYFAGPIQPGVWKLLLGIPNIRPGVQSKFTANIFFIVENDSDEFGQFNTVIRHGPAWYRGDLHTHTGHSDATCTSMSGKKVGCPVFKTLEAATARGLDFIAVSDHNSTSAYESLRELAPFFDTLAIVHARELTTFEGHANVFGTDRPFDFRVLPSDPQSMNKVLKAARAVGGLVSINHPNVPSGEQCMGCGWHPDPVTDLHLVQAVEAVNGDDAETAKSGIAFWQNLLNQGYRLTAVGGSDNHRADAPLPGAGSVGYPSTVIYADNLSEPGILAGIRAGHAFIDVEGSRDRLVEFSGRSKNKTAMMGDVLSLTNGVGKFSVHVVNVNGSTIEVIKDGSLVQTAPITGKDVTWPYELSGDQKRHWIRINVRSDAGKLLLITNPIYLNWPAQQ